MLRYDPSYLWRPVASRRIQTPSLLQTLSLVSVSRLRKNLDVDTGKEPVGIYSETQNRSYLAKQLESSPT